MSGEEGRPIVGADAAFDFVEDLINDPTHYKGRYGIEAINVVELFDLDTHRATAVIYILRAMDKGTPVADIEKAIWWLTRYLKVEHGHECTPISVETVFDGMLASYGEEIKARLNEPERATDRRSIRPAEGSDT